MRDKLLALVDLQNVDVEIANLRKSSEVLPKQFGELERQLAAARNLLEAERARVSEVEHQKKTVEETIREEKDKVKKWEQRLAEQRSTREYSALAREIDIARKSNLTLQEENSTLSKTLAEAREALKTREEEFKATQERINGEIGEVRRKLAETESQVAELMKGRDAAAKKVDATLLRRYDNVRRKRMPAMVSVVSGRCTGCNMQIPPQQYNSLCATRGVDVCPSCNRIIHAQEALEDPKPSA